LTARTAGDLVADRAAAARAAAGVVTDLDRVLDLPVDDLDDEAAASLVDALTATYARPEAVAAGTARRLRPLQALALRDLSLAPPPRGTVVGLPVGGGKTLVGMLAPLAIGQAHGAPRPARPLALVPAPLVRQWATMHADWSRDYALPPLTSYPAISHDELSSPRSSALLDRLRPDLLVIDEGHAFRHMGSARTKRLIRYVVANPGTRVVFMTGSLAAETLRDFAHLLELSLREGAPIPLDDHILGQWCACIDHRGEPERHDWSSVWPLVRRFRRTDPGPLRWDPPSERIPLSDRMSGARIAFGRRLRTAPGIVVSRGSACGAALRVRIWRPRAPVVIEHALAQLGASWRLPDGTEIVDALEVDRHRRTLSRGYYDRWRWPECSACGGSGDARPPEHRVSGTFEPCPTCGGNGRLADEVWLDARRSWSAAVRTALEYQARKGFDSPALIERAAREGRAGPDLQAAWSRWQEVAASRPYGTKGPPPERMWLDGAQAWLAAAARTWLAHVAPREAAPGDRRKGAPTPPRGLIWFERGGVEAALAAGGFAMHGAGTAPPAPYSPSPALSRRVHGTGTDGLHLSWWASLVMEPPSSGQQWEQLIGRTHRPGTRYPLIRWDVFCPTWAGRAALEEAIARTVFMAQASGLGDGAKLQIADFEEPLDLPVDLALAGGDLVEAAAEAAERAAALLAPKAPSSARPAGTFAGMGAALATARGGN